jgi:uncharacterized Rmd1/YagE family protein
MALHCHFTDKTQGELLEWIVIILIFAEVLVAGINILVDLHAAD